MKGRGALFLHQWLNSFLVNGSLGFPKVYSWVTISFKDFWAQRLCSLFSGLRQKNQSGWGPGPAHCGAAAARNERCGDFLPLSSLISRPACSVPSASPRIRAELEAGWRLLAEKLLCYSCSSTAVGNSTLAWAFRCPYFDHGLEKSVMILGYLSVTCPALSSKNISQIYSKCLFISFSPRLDNKLSLWQVLGLTYFYVSLCLVVET